MNKYNDIEIQTAKNLLEDGYKWIARERSEKIVAYKKKPHRSNNDPYCAWDYVGDYFQICTKHVPIFLNVTCMDKEPVSLESIVPPILDDVEKRYLKGVIRPFRNNVKKIYKNSSKGRERIAFYGKSYFFLPDFEAGTMYKGMEPNHWYTLEELGLV